MDRLDGLTARLVAVDVQNKLYASGRFWGLATYVWLWGKAETLLAPQGVSIPCRWAPYRFPAAQVLAQPAGAL